MASDQINKVLDYYKSTNFDYEHFWSGKRALALHFGYFDNRTTKHEDSLLRLNEVLAGLADIHAHDIVLDAGCGYGGSSIWLAENVGCKAVGMTVVPYQVEKAKSHASKSPAVGKLRFVQSDYAHTGLPDESFSVVWGVESIVHCDNKKTLIQEAYRLLKPGGRLIISEYMLREKPKLSKEEHKTLEPWLKGWAMPDLLTPSQYKRLMSDAGFKKIKIHDLSENVEPSLKKCYYNAKLAAPFVGPLKKLRLIDQFRKDYTIANYKLYDFFRDGLWRYKVIVATKD